MDAAPYYAPTYFAASYFYSVTTTTPASGSTGLQPYDAPTYFAPSYFYGPSTTATPSELLPYNAPTYFAPSYFCGPSSSVDVGPSPTPTPVPTPTQLVGDQDPYSVLIASLRSIGVFEEVIFGAATQRSQAGADTYPLAVVTPKGWEEADDFDPISIVRRTTFSISVVVASRDGLPQFEQLDRLSTAVKLAFDGSSLDGTCIGPDEDSLGPSRVLESLPRAVLRTRRRILVDHRPLVRCLASLY